MPSLGPPGGRTGLRPPDEGPARLFDTGLLLPLLLPLLLVLASALGWLAQRHMPPHHRRQETMDAIRQVMAILVTFAALVLGLLISSAKAVYDGQDAALRHYSLDLIDLDQRLREYGPEAAPERAMLRGYVTAALARVWPEGGTAPAPAPAGPDAPAPDAPGPVTPDLDAPDLDAPDLDAQALGDRLLALDGRIAGLRPATPGQQRAAALLAPRITEVLQQRWVLVEAGSATITWPFLSILALWLTVVFAIIGLSTPSNALVHVVILLGALSMAVALYLILDLETPLSGTMKIADTPLREALRQIDRPAASP